MTKGTVRLFPIALLLILAGALVAPAIAEEPTQAMCPVMPDEPIDPNYSTMYEGREIFFCCRKCLTQFEAEPGAYVANLPAVSPGSSHDHSRDHGRSAQGWRRWAAYVGRLHVMAVHFPIAFILLAAAFEILALRPRWRSLRDSVHVFVAVGAIAALGAMPLGLARALDTDYRGELAGYFGWHRTLGIAATVVALVAWWLVAMRTRAGDGDRRNLARAAIMLAAAMIATTAHLGGALVFGPGYLAP